MAIVQMLIERPHLRRSFSVSQFADPVNCLRDESIYLRRVLNTLEELAEDLHGAERNERAAGILDFLYTDLSIHAGDTEALFALLESKTEWSDDMRLVCNELREEHRAVEKLLPAVTDGLIALAKDRLPSSPQAFVIAALIFAEFFRLHIEFEQNSVLNLSKAMLSREDLENLARDMAFRRRMGPER